MMTGGCLCGAVRYEAEGEPVFAGHCRSGRPTVRHFCPTCGGLVFGEPEIAPGVIVLYAGTLDDPSAFAPRMTIYTRSRPAWDHVADDLPAFETTPPAAAAT